jgi:hypothetical protein
MADGDWPVLRILNARQIRQNVLNVLLPERAEYFGVFLFVLRALAS